MGIKRECICQICICGRHRCCGHKKHQAPFAKDKETCLTITESKDRYRPFGLQSRQQPIKPPVEASWKGDEPIVKLSITKKDYVPKPLVKRTLKRQISYKEPKGQFADCTTYRHDFIPKEILQRIKTKGLDCTRDGTMPGTLPGKIEVSTTYGRAYTPKPYIKTERIGVKEGTITVLGQPFTGETETRRCYQAPPLEKREKFVPFKGELKPEGNFEGHTTHKTDYTPKYIVPVKPIKKVSKWKASLDKFQDCTTHRHDYRCPPLIEQPVKFVPETSTQKFEGPFEGVSHYKTDYKPHDIAPRQLPDWHPSFRTHQPSDQPMLGATTYRTDYEAPPEDIQVEKSKPLRSNLTIPSGPMEKETISMRDYRKICCPVITRSFRPDLVYKKPEGRFVDCTVTRHDFTPKKGEKVTTSKQEDNLHVEGGPMEDLTTTRKDFQGICLDCPASYLKKFGKDALEPKYVFEKVEAGHQFFKKCKCDIKLKCFKK